MRFFYTYLLASLFNLLYSQDTTIFAPAGATWSYNSWTLSEPTDLYTFVVEGDTILNGHSAQILRFYNGESGTLQRIDSLTKYVHTSGNQVYYWVEDDFYLLFDFGAQPGDTINSRVEDFPISLSCGSDFSDGPFSFRYIIDSVGTILIDGSTLRKQYVTPIWEDGYFNWSMASPIIERFGLNAWASFWWGRGDVCFLGGFPGELRCYEDPDLYFRNLGAMFDLPCDYVSSVKSISFNEVHVYPNPVSDIITIPENAELIRIFNSSGQELIHSENQSQIDVSSLSATIYWIRYQLNGFWFTEKFIKL